MISTQRFMEEHLHALMHAVRDLPDAILFAVDHEQRVVLWSEGARRVFGRAGDDVLGHHCLRGVPAQQCLGQCPLRTTRRVVHDTVRVTRSGGAVVELARTLYPVWSDEERPVFLGGVEVLTEPAPLVLASRAEQAAPSVAARSEAMLEALAVARAIAGTRLPVHIEAEPGTERNRIARLIHRHSGQEGAFVHLHGAQVGLAHLERRQASATLYIEELAHVAPSLQGVLASILTDAYDPDAATPRFISSGPRSLTEEVRAGRLSPELHRVLGPAMVALPPLRERPDDVKAVVQHALVEASARSGRQVLRVEPAACEALLAYCWPGNEFELRAAIEYALHMGSSTTLRLDELPAAVRDGGPSWHPDATVADDRERRQIEQALRDHDGRVTLAADALGMSRSTLWRKRRRYGV